MKPCVLAFSGPIASGKTTIAKSLSKALEWKYASFGDFVRAEAVLRGKNLESREVLQEIGNDLISQGWGIFCKAVLDGADWKSGEGLVIDGIRHVDGMQVLKGIVVPLDVYLIYITIDKDVRSQRLVDKNIQPHDLIHIEQHSTEVQVPNALLSLADIILNGGDIADNIVATLKEWLVER